MRAFVYEQYGPPDVLQLREVEKPVPAEDEITITATPWLEEVSDPRGGDTIQWPADAEGH